MIERVEEFRETVGLAFEAAAMFRNAARAREFQADLIDDFNLLGVQAAVLKSEAASAEKEDIANELLCYQEILKSISHELEMWIALKDDDPNRAWDEIVAAETSSRMALQAHKVAIDLGVGNNIGRINALQALLFPRPIFMSTGFLAVASRCSICESEYGVCDHLAGKPYLGEICVRIIEDARLLEVSIVDEAANKSCRIISLQDGSLRRNFMSWRAENE